MSTSLSGVDTTWLRMERPTNPMMITGVLAFETPINFDRFKATIEQRLLRFDRFRQRIVPPRVPLGTPCWEDVHELDFGYHLQRISLPPPGGQAQLKDVVSRLLSTQLDFDRPLWQMTVVDNYEGGSAMVIRLHHCIADGIALMQVVFSLADREPVASWPTPERSEPSVNRSGDGSSGAPLRSAYRATSRAAGTLWHEGLETLAHPSHILDLARLGTSSAASLARIVTRWPDPKTLFKGELGVEKVAAWSQPIALAEVKEIGRGLGGTVNDVLLSAVSGALRRYALGRGENVDGLSIRGFIPVNLRAPGRELELGNMFGLVFLSLPIGRSDPLERLRSVKRCMNELKRSPEAAVGFSVLRIMGLTPPRIQDLAADIFCTKGSVVMTNVPGPKEALYVAGARLSTVMGWVPESGNVGLGVSIISYNGQVRLGVASDKGLVPDPETIVSLYHEEFDALLALVRRRLAARHAPVKAMMAMLDDALARLDSMLEEEPPGAPGAAAQPALLPVG